MNVGGVFNIQTFNVACCRFQLPVARCQSSVAGCRLLVASCQLLLDTGRQYGEDVFSYPEYPNVNKGR